MPKLFVAIPAMDELEFLPNTLNFLRLQKTNFDFEVFVCVNQPESFWDDTQKIAVCENNARTLEFLSDYDFLTLNVIDRSSRGSGWEDKKSGVGFARKVLFDSILEKCNPEDIIVSLDADTEINPGYLQSVYDNFLPNPKLNAISVPYYHKISGCVEIQAKALLRYEIYMRNYLINLQKIGSPYAFTALGSAIAVRAEALLKIGGITPYPSGEDFYLVQKIAKMGGLSNFNTELVYPSPRFSNRVPFGTGPAVGRGVSWEWGSYPIYHFSCFESIYQIYNELEALYENNESVSANKFLQFLSEQSRSEDVWRSVRANVSDYQRFVKAFHQKADGLRILQFVRFCANKSARKDEECLYDNLKRWFPSTYEVNILLRKNFKDMTVWEMDALRNLLFEVEMDLRKQ